MFHKCFSNNSLGLHEVQGGQITHGWDFVLVAGGGVCVLELGSPQGKGYGVDGNV